MTTRVKICGITRRDDAALAVELGAAAVGFVFWPDSPRGIGPHQARPIARALPALVARVGVFVNPSADVVRAAVDIAGLDTVQLHGDEDVADYAGLGVRLIKTVPLSDDDALERARALPPEVTPLVDVADRSRRGGTGQRADWARAALLAAERPTMLAGGLTPENVALAIATVRPFAIDVSSGVEAVPGVKSPERLRAFFAALGAPAAAERER
jgi:phosphoribosylanthranilate isomerase